MTDELIQRGMRLRRISHFRIRTLWVPRMDLGNALWKGNSLGKSSKYCVAKIKSKAKIKNKPQDNKKEVNLNLADKSVKQPTDT